MPDMRFAPPPSLRIGGSSGGLNQVSVRSYNERLVMSLLLQHNGMSRIEMCRISGLSAQTISVIVRGLERDGMILRGEAQRGRVGPPTIPMYLNPEGAFSVGADVGPHSVDVVLIDFAGAVRHKTTADLRSARVDEVAAALDGLIPEALAQLDAGQTQRLAGIGLTLPSDFDHWPGELAPGIADFEQHLNRMTGQQTFIQDQVTAAAGAVGMFEQPPVHGDYLFCLIGPEVSNRLILDHHVYAGVEAGERAIEAGLTGLDRRLLETGSTRVIWRRDEDWPEFGAALDDWIEVCSDNLIRTLISLRQFVSVDQLIVAGHAPETICTRICATAQRKLEAAKPEAGLGIRQSGLGTWVSAIGAARLPFHSRFMVQGE